jgi:hypothetical protein
MRASRESELMREYDLATVCRWIGNSPAVATKHHATSIDLDADFRRAIGLGPAETQQEAQQSASADDEQGVTDETRDHADTPERPEQVTRKQLCATADTTAGWALQDSNL